MNDDARDPTVIGGDSGKAVSPDKQTAAPWRQDQAYHCLAEHLRGFKRIAIAASGGTDSSLLAAVAAEVLGRDNVLLVTAIGEIFGRRDQADATELAERLDLRRIVLTPQLLDQPAFRDNPPDRCYHCKKLIFSALVAEVASQGDYTVCDGGNIDDMGDYRPGHRALRELGIRSPLMECGLGKEQIRRLSRLMGLPTADKPAYACLASRIPYGMAVTSEALRQVAEGEELLHEAGYHQSRLRHHGEIARLEVSPDDIERVAKLEVRSPLVAALKRIGYRYVTLDLEGYRTGSLNEGLDILKPS